MTSNEKLCPICEHSACRYPPPNQDAYVIECQRCGRFVMSGHLLLVVEYREGLSEEDKRLLPYLSAYTRQSTERGILSELHTDNWRDLARTHTTTPVSQKVTKLLELLAARSSYPGDRVKIDADFDYPLLDANSASEVHYLLRHLTSLNYLIDEVDSYTITIKGWEHLEPPAGGNGIPGRCFIAMSFDPSLNDAYELGIRPAVLDCGFEPIRIDKVYHNEKICDKILAEIRLCQFIVSDFTFQRGGVYFEAGFAMGLGRPVIWTCRKDDFDNTHFDTRQYNHIVWSMPEDLRAKLSDRIRATILK